MLRKIYDEALEKPKAYEWLEYLSNNIGGRLSGSPEAAAAVEWSRQVMDTLGFDTVYLQEVMVPHWIRGKKEEGKIMHANHFGSIDVPILALGGSVATPSSGLSAEVVEVKDFDELKALGNAVAGKIVFFNRPFDRKLVNMFAAYSGAVNQRSQGAIEAAKLGAVGVVVRSMNPFDDDHPHTGGVRYDDDAEKIPAVAISTNGANRLSALLADHSDLRFFMKVNAKQLEDKLSYNVIGEIKGSSHADEIIVVGGHLDSWDIGDGAHDDGAGCMQAIEALHIFKKLDIQPKRTLRAVMYMNEENGLRGGREYAAQAKENNEQHIAAIESDAGGFTPRGFSIDGTSAQLKSIQNWKSLFEPYGVHQIEAGGGGADIGPLKDGKVALIGLRPDSQRYFYIHHAETDTFEQVNQRELALCTAAMTSLIYLIDTHGVSDATEE